MIEPANGELSDEELKNKRVQVLGWYSRINAMYKKHQSGR